MVLQWYIVSRSPLASPEKAKYWLVLNPVSRSCALRLVESRKFWYEVRRETVFLEKPYSSASARSPGVGEPLSWGWWLVVGIEIGGEESGSGPAYSCDASGEINVWRQLVYFPIFLAELPSPPSFPTNSELPHQLRVPTNTPLAHQL